MDKKKIVALVALAAAFCLIPFCIKEANKTDKTDIQTQENQEEIEFSNNEDMQKSKESATEQTTTKGAIVKGEVEKTENAKRTNTYDLSMNAPLCAISVLADLPANIQDIVKKNIDNFSETYMVKRIGDRILLVSENSDNIRHGIDFVEVSTITGHQTRTTLGYNGKIKDSENDIWIYDETTPEKHPKKHTKYNKDGDVEFIETWSYDAGNPIKYEMKNAEGKPLSIRKETLTGDSDLRVEHLIYDKDGKTKVNVTTTFEGPNIKRFTYYNSDKPQDSASVFSEYNEGDKVKETVYTSDLKVKNVYEGSYDNGELQSITVLDANNKTVGSVKKSN